MNESQGKSKRHHFVSQAYLKGFSCDYGDSDKMIWVYNKNPGKKPRLLSTKSVAWRLHYYAQVDENGNVDSDSLEHAFGKVVENPASEIIRSLQVKSDRLCRISDEQRQSIAFFVAFSLTRIPSFRDGLEALCKKVIEEAAYSAARKYDELSALIDNKELTIEADDSSQISLRLLIKAADALANFFWFKGRIAEVF